MIFSEGFYEIRLVIKSQVIQIGGSMDGKRTL